MKTLPRKSYCNCLAQQRGLDPVGHAGSFDTAIVIEVPLPWKIDMMQKVGVLPQEVIDLLELWLKRYSEGEGYPHLPVAIAPDTQYSKAGYRRVMYFTRPTGLFYQFDKVEYLVPEDKVGALVWSLYQDHDALSYFEAYRIQDAGKIRDILVCTHGTVDAACAKFGFPLFKYLRNNFTSDHLRLWRVSHFGGHVFAPTMMDMPTGHLWAYVGNEQAEQIIRRSGDISPLRSHYRGWAGLENGFLQTAEYELWQQVGWQWFDYPKSGELTQQDDDQHWAEVCLHYRIPDNAVPYAVNMRIEISHTIETPHTTGIDASYGYQQYSVTPINENAG